ncbi:transglutaminase-like cysteine peptidase [Afifella sp. IM 167]|uniref:transglutaminase-like cysteine peptidase n=1 Tax=Afifella sp. IM 167 TaxID=2033586 RepID=UPI001CCA7452|nr:transglutaminase-like cysteine peptidase [Afifella sp. IM 167]
MLPIMRTAALALVVGMATPAAAMENGLQSVLAAYRSSPAPYIGERSPALAPMGYVMFCVHNPSKCLSSSTTQLVRLTGDRLYALQAVNRFINHTVEPRHDRNDRIDEWRIARTSGDCEDFALAKREKLIELGWPAAALRIAVTRMPDGQGHAVLIVRTSLGDLVLDNRRDRVEPWWQSDLRWAKIQSGKNPRTWFATWATAKATPKQRITTAGIDETRPGT